MILQRLQQRLQQQKARSLYRSRKVLESAQSTEPVIDGRRVLSFCSNDYLGLANAPEVRRAFQQAANEYGVGSGASHLISGHSREHHQLEAALADFMCTERVLLFSTGYMANIGVLAALCDRHSEVFEDKLNHASLLDAAQLSRAKRVRYAHADLNQLQQRLQQSGSDNRLIVSDGVFSMDGDMAAVDQLVALADSSNIALMIDDAHGIGVLGEQGRGVLEHFQLQPQQVPILVGTLGKAFGTAGAFVAGSETLIETLIQSARSYIYTTAMPAAVAAATRQSLKMVVEQGWRRQQLQQLIARFRQGAAQLGLSLLPSETAIQPLLLGENDKAVQWSEQLLQQGILVSAIRPPTVPQGMARLRITFCATHTEAQVDRLLDALQQLAGQA